MAALFLILAGLLELGDLLLIFRCGRSGIPILPPLAAVAASVNADWAPWVRITVPVIAVAVHGTVTLMAGRRANRERNSLD